MLHTPAPFPARRRPSCVYYFAARQRPFQARKPRRQGIDRERRDTLSSPGLQVCHLAEKWQHIVDWSAQGAIALSLPLLGDSHAQSRTVQGANALNTQYP